MEGKLYTENKLHMRMRAQENHQGQNESRKIEWKELGAWGTSCALRICALCQKEKMILRRKASFRQTVWSQCIRFRELGVREVAVRFRARI